MAINLEKGQRVSIGLQRVGVGLGWDPSEGTGHDFDLDASAFMLTESGKIPSDEYFIFYSNLKSPDGSVVHHGDEQTGSSSEGDEENITIDLGAVNSQVQRILIVVSIHDYETRKQNFGQVRNSYLRIFDEDTTEEICKYELDEDFSTETALEFGSLYRHTDGWKFEAIGKGAHGGLQGFVNKYA